MKYGENRGIFMDIDSDLHTELRAKVIDYVKAKYGERAVCNIITKGTNAGKGAIRAVGRVTDIEPALVDKVARMIPNTPNAKLSDAPEELLDLCKTDPKVNRLMEDAKLIEGVTVSYGMHAAGVIISDNDNVGDYVALMKNDDGFLVAQCDMGQAEKDAHLLKMDFLGLRNLDIITDTLRRIKTNKGISIDMERDVPVDDKNVYKYIFSTGKTNSVFQFESGGMKNMLRRFKPDKMEDLILLVAAYRPGPLQYLDQIIDVKHGKEIPRYIARGIKEILDPTYGSTIYQEQVQQLFNKVAGFSLGEADIVRRSMSKKKLEILTDPKTNYKGRFIDGLQKAGASAYDAEEFWTQLLDFASYAFNQSHAAAYAYVAYLTAWLKYYYPAEYMCSVMAKTNINKLPALLSDCRDMGLKISPPDINSSQINFINIDKKILFGFNNVRGVGNAGDIIIADRNKYGKYDGFKDFIERMQNSDAVTRSVSKSVCEALIKGGAFDAFYGGNRKVFLESLEECVDLTKKLAQKQTQLEERKIALEEMTSAPAKEKKKAEKLVENTEKAVKKLRDNYSNFTFPRVDENTEQKMKDEYECLGAYLSGNPLERYRTAIQKIAKEKRSYTSIADMDTRGNALICCMVKDLDIKSRRADGKKFCIMNVFDETDEIQVKCFTSQYDEYCDLIKEGAALCIYGWISCEEDDEDSKSLNVKEISVLVPETTERIYILVNGIQNYVRIQNKLKAFMDNTGIPLWVYDNVTKEHRQLKMNVKRSILDEDFGVGVTTKLIHH